MEGQWVQEELARLQLPGGSHANLWRSFARELFIRIEEWEEGERRSHPVGRWDFCVVHSKHPEDTTMAQTFKRLLETSLGLTGRTLGEVALGENTLEAAGVMIEGSTKVFILASQNFNRLGVPKFVFQTALMQEIQGKRWRCKIVPLILPGGHTALPFGLRAIQGLTITRDEPRTVELVSGSISLEEQLEVRAAQRRSEARLEERLRLLRALRVREVQQVVAGLREEFGDYYDPTQELQQMTEQLREVQLLEQYQQGATADQVINVSGCSNISVGPSFHFAVAGTSNRIPTTTTTPGNGASNTPSITPSRSSSSFTSPTIPSLEAPNTPSSPASHTISSNVLPYTDSTAILHSDSSFAAPNPSSPFSSSFRAPNVPPTPDSQANLSCMKTNTISHPCPSFAAPKMPSSHITPSRGAPKIPPRPTSLAMSSFAASNILPTTSSTIPFTLNAPPTTRVTRVIPTISISTEELQSTSTTMSVLQDLPSRFGNPGTSSERSHF